VIASGSAWSRAPIVATWKRVSLSYDAAQARAKTKIDITVVAKAIWG
jgi:hypothetical protein